jgi:hypothetical protein
VNKKAADATHLERSLLTLDHAQTIHLLSSLLVESLDLE